MEYYEIQPQDKVGLLKIVASELNKDIAVLNDFKKFSNIIYDIYVSRKASAEKAISLIKLLPETVGYYRLHSEENKRKFRENMISMDDIDDIDASFISYEAVVRYLGRESSEKNIGSKLAEALKNFQRFYVWKCEPINMQSESPKWHKLYDDGWFIYEEKKKLLTKTTHLFLDEVEDYIRKNFSNSLDSNSSQEIITAAPKNIERYSELFDIKPGQLKEVNNLDFTGLKENALIFIKSCSDEDLTDVENLYIDISYKKIINNIPTQFDSAYDVLEKLRKAKRGERQNSNPIIRSKYDYLKNLRKQALAEYQAQYPNLTFEALSIFYKTYNHNPACFRSFDELYETFERNENNEIIKKFKEFKKNMNV